MLLAWKPITDISPTYLERTRGQWGPLSLRRWDVQVRGKEGVAFIITLSSHTCLTACDSIFLRTEIWRLSSGRDRFTFLKIADGQRRWPHSSCFCLQKPPRSREIVSASSLSSPACVSSPLAHSCNCSKVISQLLSWFLVKTAIPDLIPTNLGHKGGCKSSTTSVPAFSTSSVNGSFLVKQWAKLFLFLPLLFKAVKQIQSLSQPLLVFTHFVP